MRLSRRSAVLSATLAIVAAAIAAFNWQPITGWFRPPSPPEKLTIAISDPLGSGLVRIAAAQDYFAAEGLEVTLQIHTSGRSALEAAIANQAALATVGDTPVMFAVARQAPVSIVATIRSSVNSEGILAWRNRGVSAPAELKGKTIGVPLGTSTQFLLSVILANQGIAMHEVSIRNLQPQHMAAALSAGEVDAIAIWDPWLIEATKAAGANGVSFFAEKGYSFQFHLAGRRNFVQNHPATMQKLLRALLRAEQYLGEHAQEARAMLIDDTKIDPALFDTIWPNYSLSLTLNQASLNMLEDQARWAISNGLVETKVVPNFLDAIYLDAMLAVKPAAVSIVR